MPPRSVKGRSRGKSQHGNITMRQSRPKAARAVERSKMLTRGQLKKLMETNTMGEEFDNRFVSLANRSARLTARKQKANLWKAYKNAPKYSLLNLVRGHRSQFGVPYNVEHAVAKASRRHHARSHPVVRPTHYPNGTKIWATKPSKKPKEKTHLLHNKNNNVERKALTRRLNRAKEMRNKARASALNRRRGAASRAGSDPVNNLAEFAAQLGLAGK